MFTQISVQTFCCVHRNILFHSLASTLLSTWKTRRYLRAVWGLHSYYTTHLCTEVDFWVCYFGEVEKGSTLVFKQYLPTVKHKESKVKERTRNLLPLHLISHRKAEMSLLWMGYSFLVDIYTNLNCYISEEMWKDVKYKLPLCQKHIINTLFCMIVFILHLSSRHVIHANWQNPIMEMTY